MPVNLKDLKNRIKSVKNTQQITKAMKLVSAAKFGRAQHAVLAARPYAKALGGVVGSVLGASGSNEIKHNLLNQSDSKRILFVIVSSERGLCGGFNSNVAKFALKEISEAAAVGAIPTVVCIGKKAYQLLVRKREQMGLKAGTGSLKLEDWETLEDDTGILDKLNLLQTPFDKPGIQLTNRLANVIRAAFEKGTFGEIRFVYNKFQSVVAQVPTLKTVLPLTDTPVAGGSVESAGNSLFEPDPVSLLDSILPRYFLGSVYQLFLESSASEHGARMTAMDAATRNAKQMERKLQITYQRARQAAITTELIEIISGAEAL
jgi:F-type H+-transporting ATPase subunit gamma